MNGQVSPMRLTAIVIGMALLGGCVTTGGGGSVRQVITTPPGALLTIDGVGECETPCSVKLDGPRQARIAKAGFITVTIVLTPGRKAITVPLELAAASESVDTQALPAID